MEDVKQVPTKPSGTQPVTRDDWVSNLKNWAFQLTVLKVVTYVGDATIELTADGVPQNITVVPGGKALVTVCDLIGGDITNVIPAEYKDDEGLRTFHAQQVASAGAVLPNNLRVLTDLVDKLFNKA